MIWYNDCIMSQNSPSSAENKSFKTHADEAISIANPAKNIEVTDTSSPKQEVKIRWGRVLATSAAVGTVAIAFMGEGVSANNDKDTQKPDVVQIESPGSMTPWELAQDVKDEDADLREVAGAIQEQADSMGDKGVDAYEVFTLPDEYISEEAERQYAPEEPR